MRQRISVFIILSFATLLWTAHSVLAQKGPGLTEKEFAPNWERANSLFLKGKDHFGKRELDKAKAQFKACLEVVPEHADALFFLAQVGYLQGDFAQALADIQKAEAGHAMTTGAHSFIDAERRKALLDERAKKEQEIAFMEDTLYAANCKTEQELLKLPESIEAFRRKISSLNAMLNEQSQSGPRALPADYSYVHGNILFKMNNLQEASDQYLKAIEADAGHLRAYNNLVNICYLIGDYEKALKFIKQAETNGVELNPMLREAVLKTAQK
jgi:pentatricopeptide repeat protein